MKLTLNIGLDVNATSLMAADVVKQIIAANDFVIEKSAVIESDTEPTLVAEILVLDSPALAWQKLKQIANDLQQDCIAAFNPASRTGALVGPRAAKWGAFNPEFFFLLNGKRLSVPTAVSV